MGVRGLTTYINYNQDAFLQYHLLHGSCLVIDGNSLCAQLYRLLNCFSAFGGDYDKFAIYTKNFFKNLRKCNVTPYVLFDGSYERRKLKTAYSRLRSKINGASRLDPVTQGSLQIFPVLLRDVFKEALVDMKIPFSVCEFEADDEIAAMARHLNCPVLSYDSDFFIYNVQYIPFNTLDLKPTNTEIDGNKIHVLECKIYKVEYLANSFGGLKEEMLPLLATLLGNDYVEKRVFSKFFSQLKLPKSKSSKNEQQRCIHGLFKWLQNETLDTAIAKILGRLKKARKDKVFFIIKRSIEGYSRTNCRSLKYFNICNDPKTLAPELNMPQTPDNIEVLEDNDASNHEDEESSESADENSGEEETAQDQLVLGIPDWFAEGVRNFQIPHSIINLYTHHLHFCSPQAEDYTQDDSFLCALSILRYSFDIMTDFEQENCIYVSREKNCSYRRIFIDKEYSIPRLLEVSFQELSDEQLKLYFHNFLKVKLPSLDIDAIDSLPSNFQLFMITVIWWIANCEVKLGHVHSLFMSYIMLEVIDEKIGTFRGHYHFNNKFSKKIEEIKKHQSTFVEDNELYLNKNKVQYDDCLVAASVLLKHFEIDDKIKKKPKSYDAKKMQLFAQFQYCLQQFNCLNILCRCPFERTKYSKSFNGTFVYNLAEKFESQVAPKTFVEQYLQGAGTVLMFYRSICTVYEKIADNMGLKTKEIQSVGKKRRKKKDAQLLDKEINFIVRGFESDVVI